MTVRSAAAVAIAVLVGGLCTPAAASALTTAPVTARGAWAAAPAVAAEARVARCAGRRATVTGTSGTLRGTPGRDVIVASGRADRVLAGGGADLVCVRTDFRAWVTVEGGDGDDRILVQRRARVMAMLGGGDDVYRGGPGFDWVNTSYAGSRDGRPHFGPGRDRVRTGGGEDSVSSGVPGRPNRDRIDTGGGEDVVRLWLSDDHSRASVSGGDGRDELSLEVESRGTLAVDAARGAATLRGRPLASWRDVEDYALDGRGRLVFHGSDRDDFVSFGSSAGGIEARTGGGDDQALLRWVGSLAASTPPLVLDGGEGQDLLEVSEWSSRAVADLRTGRFETTDFGSTTGFDFAGFESLGVFYDWNGVGLPDRATIEITGDAGDNHLQADACDVVIRGGAGDDHLRVGADVATTGLINYAPRAERCRGTSQVHGEEGDDVLVSQGWQHTRRGNREVPYDDVLDGGEGTDTADGGLGRDTCVAESQTRCEA